MLQTVTRNELYGYVHPSTREWKEGLISTTFRDMSNNRSNTHQWILLDGDIDAEWIEVCQMLTLCPCPHFNTMLHNGFATILSMAMTSSKGSEGFPETHLALKSGENLTGFMH